LVVSELRQRIRGRRWWILLLLWFLVLLGLMLVIQNAAEQQAGFYPRRFREPPLGPSMFGSLTLLIVGLSCLIIPSLTSTSINGERDRGTLAVLQSTLYRPRDIVLAKFLAAMVVALTFLVLTLPLTWWCFSEGGVHLGRTIVVYAIIILVLALMVLIGLAASALIRKPSLSAAAAYGFVFLLTIGSPILFGLLLLGAPDVVNGYERQVGWRWIILAPDPVVVLADAAPRAPRGPGVAVVSDPLESIREAVRDARRPPEVYNKRGRQIDPATGEVIEFDPFTGEPELKTSEPPALWPWGLAIDVLIGAGAAYLAIERLRIPTHKLATGERVA
jgi:ABC-type transport system involved in multi-copper enzyme maturation permease subunit